MRLPQVHGLVALLPVPKASPATVPQGCAEGAWQVREAHPIHAMVKLASTLG
jgi:hypothetical protein